MTISVKDATGATLALGSSLDAGGNVVPENAILANGVPVTTAAPMPTVDAVAGAALGAPADAAWSGAGAASAIAALKAIATGLGGVVLADGSSVVGGVTQSGVWTFGLTDALPAGSNALGSVSISNLPSVQPVSIAGTVSTEGTVSIAGTIATAGTVAISNLPVTQPVSGTVSLAGTIATAGTVAISNLPVTQPVQDAAAEASLSSIASALAGTIATAGTVAISNLPSVQLVQDAAAEASLSSIASALAGTIATAGTVMVAGVASVQDSAAETSLASIAASAANLAANDAPSASWWTQSLESTQAIQAAVERGWAPESDEPLIVQFEPGNPPVVSGLDQGGAPRALGVDRSGGVRPADADVPIMGASSNATTPVLVVDTRGFNSVSLHLMGSWTGTVSFYTSNTGDPLNWQPMGGWNANYPGGASETTTANGVFAFPCIGRYLRVMFSTATSGTVVACAYLRSEPMLVGFTNLATNTAQIGANTVVTANVNGMLAVGGNIAPGAAPTAYPVLTAGVDTAGLTRRLLTDTTGAPIMAGTDSGGTPRRVLTDAAGMLAQPRDADSGLTTTDLLRLILAELRIISFISASDQQAGDPDDLRASSDFSTILN